MYITNFLKRSLRPFSLIKSTLPANSIIGKLYEQKCQTVVSESFETPVALVGGANDGGVDLTWNKMIRSHDSVKVNFIAQCKYRDAKRVQPDVVRGLEGSLSAHQPNTVGVLITNCRPSNESLLRLQNSVYPMMYLGIKEEECCKHIYEVLLNKKLSDTFPEIKPYVTRISTGAPFFKFKFN